MTEARARGGASGLSRAGLVLGILATLAANVAAGAQFGIVGGLVNAWPAIAFIVASEILLRMLRAARNVPSAQGAAGTVAAVISTPSVSTLETVADVPGDVLPEVPVDAPVSPASVPDDGPEDVAVTVPADVPDVAPVAPLRPLPQRTPRRASPGRPKAPERVFAAEIQRGELPSLREVMRRAGCGQPCAREILAELAETVREKAA